MYSGHVHEHEHIFERGTHEIVQGTVCGAWWAAPICWDGTPNGYGVYEVNGSDISWPYKSTGLMKPTRCAFTPGQRSQRARRDRREYLGLGTRVACRLV